MPIVSRNRIQVKHEPVYDENGRQQKDEHGNLVFSEVYVFTPSKEDMTDENGDPLKLYDHVKRSILYKEKRVWIMIPRVKGADNRITRILPADLSPYKQHSNKVISEVILEDLQHIGNSSADQGSAYTHPSDETLIVWRNWILYHYKDIEASLTDEYQFILGEDFEAKLGGRSILLLVQELDRMGWFHSVCTFCKINIKWSCPLVLDDVPDIMSYISKQFKAA